MKTGIWSNDIVNNHLDPTADKAKRLICLIVEDHAPLRIVLGEWLRIEFPGATFIEVETGEDAVELTKTLHPDLVVIDIGLQGINGIETTRQIKKTHPRTKVIIHTIFDSSPFRDEARLAGADFFIPKNQSQSNLVSILGELLSSNH